MKKYVKPELFYERYELTEQIADCSWEVQNSGDRGDCVVVSDPDTGWGGLNLFVDNEMGCDITDPNPQFYCYQTGPGGMNSFVS